MRNGDSSGYQSATSVFIGIVSAAAMFGITYYFGFLSTEYLVVRPNDADWIFGVLAIVPLLVTVSVVAFVTRRRLFFVMGVFGACAGPILLGVERIQAPVIYRAELNALAWFWCGLVASLLALLIDRWVVAWEQKSDFRVSISDAVQAIFLIALLIFLVFRSS